MRLPGPGTPDPFDAPVLRWGILGSGNIASVMARSLTEGTSQRLEAVGSRSLERSRAFADQHGVARAHGSYEDLVADAGVDVVYVATPHSEHLAHALLAIGAGKHVLVEKAFTRDADQARVVFDAARDTGVTCVEAMWSAFLPGYDVIRRSVEAGLLGRLRTVGADLGRRLYPDGPERLARPELAGGALLDLGVYPLHLAMMLVPQVDDLRVTGSLTDLGVDEQETITWRGGDAVLATCTASMSARSPSNAVIAGTEARLDVAGPFYRPTHIRLVDRHERVLDEWSTDDDLSIGLRYEAAELARCAADGRLQSAAMPWSQTLRVMDLMDHVRRELGVRFPGE